MGRNQIIVSQRITLDELFKQSIDLTFKLLMAKYAPFAKSQAATLQKEEGAPIEFELRTIQMC